MERDEYGRPLSSYCGKHGVRFLIDESCPECPIGADPDDRQSVLETAHDQAEALVGGER